MTDVFSDHLIQGHFDDALSEVEQAEFAALMRDSEAARLRFWELAEVHGLARDAARIAWPESDVAIVPPPARRSFATAFARLRPAGLVAAGLVLGVLMTGLAWAIARPQWSSGRLLLDESFESNAAPIAGGVPTAANEWSGDVVEVVAAQSSVQPVRDQHMLRFLRADFAGKVNPGGYIGEVYRLLDVRDLRSELADDNAVVQVSALFNAGDFGDGERYHCSVAVFALDHETATVDLGREVATLGDRALAVTRRSNDLLDRNPKTWQKVSTELRLPANTDFLLLRISVGHGQSTRNSQDRTMFSAHFADDVRVTLVRRPLLP